MRVILAGVIGVILLATISCTKTNNVTTTIHDTTTLVYKDTVYIKNQLNPITGSWVGTYKWVGGNANDSFYYSFDIQANGKIISTSIANGSSSASEGTWSLNGTNFTATTTELTLTSGTPKVVVALTAAYDSVAGTLNGQAAFPGGQNATYLLNRIH